MLFFIIKKVVLLISNKVIVIINSIDKIINLPKTSNRTFTYVIKVIKATTDPTKGNINIDFDEQLLVKIVFVPPFQQLVLQRMGYKFVLRLSQSPILTFIVTMLILIGCKVFIRCSKKSKLP